MADLDKPNYATTRQRNIRKTTLVLLAEKLVTGRSADYLGYFFNFGKFTPSDQAHYVKAYTSPAQLHAAFETYRAFPANAQFNATQREPNSVPLFLLFGILDPLDRDLFLSVECGTIEQAERSLDFLRKAVGPSRLAA